MTALVDDEPVTREDIVLALHFLNAGAKDMSRRGLIGTLSAEYAKRHEQINQRLGDLERATA